MMECRMTEAHDAVYYDAVGKVPIARRIMNNARAGMFDLFMERMRPNLSTTILDIGASEVMTDGANYLEAEYPWPHRITCAGIGDGAEIRGAFPTVQYQSILPGAALPFADKSFDIAYSNAVLEHVGPDRRSAFISEALRVAHSVFIAVPNRWFPVEHHTGIPLLHYVPAAFRRITRATRFDYWSRPENVDFLSASTIAAEWPDKTRPEIVYSGVKLGPLSSNLVAIQLAPSAPERDVAA
jgi:hypothetical protein